jgi:hypothetical protein
MLYTHVLNRGGGVCGARLMGFETIVVDSMPIHITHRDKKSASTQHADVSWVMADVKIASMASYMDRRQVFRMLCGSI